MGRLAVVGATFALAIALTIGLTSSSIAESDNDYWTDPDSGLMWQIVPTGPWIGGPTMEWKKAVDHCAGLELGGMKGWHLPTIDELRTLVVGCDKTKKGGPCLTKENDSATYGDNPCGGCDSLAGSGQGNLYLPPALGSKGEETEYWSSSSNGYSAWCVDFAYAGIRKLAVDDSDPDPIKLLARCVHNK